MLGTVLREFVPYHRVQIGILVVGPLESVSNRDCFGGEFVSLEIAGVGDTSVLDVRVGGVRDGQEGAGRGAGAGVRGGKLSQLLLAGEVRKWWGVSVALGGVSRARELYQVAQVLWTVRPLIRRADDLSEGNRAHGVSPISRVGGNGRGDVEEERVLSNLGRVLEGGADGRGDRLERDLRDVQVLFVILLRALLWLEVRQSLLHFVRIGPEGVRVSVHVQPHRALGLLDVEWNVAVAPLEQLSELGLGSDSLEVVDEQVVGAGVRIVLLIRYTLQRELGWMELIFSRI